MGGAACKPTDRPPRPTSVTIVLPGAKTGPPAQGVPIHAVPPTDATLEELYDEHYVRLVRLAVLLLRDAGRAEEVVQDTFVAMYQRMQRSGADPMPENAPAYLRQAVVNRSRSVLRHLKVVARHPGETLPSTPEHHPGADHDTLHAERRRAVLEALARLPRRQREVLALRHYLQLSEREIAETLGISPGAVKSHASRGAAALRQSLSDLLEEQP
jgi:RNA polymerase sigma-70 factor (sigma-E family)